MLDGRTISWDDRLTANDRTKPLTTANVRHEFAAIYIMELYPAGTVECTDFVLWCLLFAERLKSSATLVVCPASLVHQWNNEIDRRVKRGTLDVVLYHGANRVSSPTRCLLLAFSSFASSICSVYSVLLV